MARKEQDNPALDMTPMIDVVFELIIFFVVTIKQEDIFSRLNANRPQAANTQSKSEDIPINIDISRGKTVNGAIVYNGVEVKRSELDAYLHDVAKTSRNKTIVVRCTNDSPHKALVDVLDICYRHQLFCVSVFTL